MKILFITDLYPVKSGETNTPIALHNFVIEWIKQGHSVNVIKPNFIFNNILRGKPLYLDGFYEYNGVKIYNVNYFTPFLFKFLNKIPNQIKFDNYDIIIGHMPCGIIFANKMAGTTRIPLVCGVHCSDIKVLTEPTYSFYFKKQLEKAYTRAKKIACRSFVLQRKFNKLMPQFAKKTFVAPSGVSFTGLGNPLDSSFFKLSHSIKVVTCANLIKRKNVDKLILAIKELDGFELKVIGDGPELNHLKEISTVKIKFTGRLPHDKVLQEMKHSNIFILPSINETFGLVYLEAMSAGCIVAGIKNDGIDGIIQNEENGFLCEPTVESIKETLLKIKHYSDIEKISKNSIATVKMYSPEACAKNYLKNII